jgi:predicted Holliday junction resolvase-like endonuclease
MAISNKGITLPSWAATIIVTIFLALFSLSMAVSAKSQKMESDIEHNEEEINKKASEEKVQMVYDAVLRMEKKLDEYVKEN